MEGIFSLIPLKLLNLDASSGESETITSSVLLVVLCSVSTISDSSNYALLTIIKFCKSLYQGRALLLQGIGRYDVYI